MTKKLFCSILAFALVISCISYGKTAKEIVDQASFEDFFKLGVEQFASEEYTLSASTYQLLLDECNNNSQIKTNNLKVCNNIETKYLPYSYYYAGRKYMDNKDYKSAKPYLLKSIEYNIPEPNAYADLGYIAIEDNNATEAKTYYEQAYKKETEQSKKEIIKEILDKLGEFISKTETNKQTNQKDLKTKEKTASINDKIDDGYCSIGFTLNGKGTECITHIERCQEIYGENGMWKGDKCGCKGENTLINGKCEHLGTAYTKEGKNWLLKESISWMYDNGLTKFNTPETFMDKDSLTREQASKFFAQFASKVLGGEYTDNIDYSVFKDISNADPTLTYYIIQSHYLGLFQGVNGNFMPFNKLTQAQALAVIIRMLDGKLNENINPRYDNYYQRAKQYNLLAGGSDFNFNILDKTNITRGDMAIIIYNAYQHKLKEGEYVCKVDWGEFSKFTGEIDSDGDFICGCEEGYYWDDDDVPKYCVNDKMIEEGNRQCKEQFGKNAASQGTPTNEGYMCYCQEGYNRDSEENPTKCI